MINFLSRPLLAVVGSLFIVLCAMPAHGQRFMKPEIIEAESITEDMSDEIIALVDPPLFDMSDEDVAPEEVKEAREQIQSFFRPTNASPAYLEALSKAISERIGEAVGHNDPIVRMNAMILIGLLVDDGSKALIDKGLKDDNDAVQHWAMVALGKRIQSWQLKQAAGGARGIQAKIDAAIGQIKKLVLQETPPHTIVVSAALESLVKVNTPMSREALIGILNARVALHAADPDLTYSPERSAVESFTNVLVGQVPPDMQSIKGYSQALGRYGALIVDQSKRNQLDPQLEKGAHAMLYLSLQGLANVCAAAKAPNSPPANHGQGRDWIKNARWDDLNDLVVKDWGAILQAAPIGLNQQDLAVKP